MGWTINSLSPIHAPKVVFLSLSFRIGGSVLQFSGLCAGHTFSSWQAPIAQQHWRCDHHVDHAFPRVRLVLHAAGESNSPTLHKLFVVVTLKMFKAQPPNPSRMLECVSFPSLLSYRRSSTLSYFGL